MTETVQDEVKRDVVNRLRRARGQLDAVIRTIENDGDCRSVVTQLSAVGAAVHRAGFVVVASGLKHCLATDAGGNQDSSIEEMEKLFMMLG